MSLNASLDSINRSAESVKSLYFAPSGMFANALTLKPYITKLIRDAQDREASLYVVNKELEEARRVDGSKSFMESVDLDEENAETEDNEHLQDVESVGKRSATVKIPSVKIDAVLEKEDYKMQAILNKLQSGNYSIDVLIESVKELVDSNQSILNNQDEILRSLDDKRRRFEALNRDIEALESGIELQKRQLNMGEEATAEDPTQHQTQHQTHQTQLRITISAKELIEKEEQEIRELEQLLMNKKKQEKEISHSIVSGN